MIPIWPSLDISVFNVLKFIIISLVLNPILEILVDSVVSSFASYHVLCGGSVIVSETKLGILSLHSNFYGRNRNRWFIVALALVIFALELLLEFSFTTATIHLAGRRVVWSQPSHTSRYLPPDSWGSGDVSDEPTTFLENVSSNSSCIGPAVTFRTLKTNHSKSIEHFQGGFLFEFDSEISIRKPYIDAMNDEVLCSIDSEAYNAKFVVRDGYKVKTGSDTEGLPCVFRQERYQFYWSLLNEHKFEEFKYEYRSAKVNERGSCIDSGWETICIVTDDKKNVALLYSQTGKRCNTTGLIVMEASGTALKNMVEHGRQIRFMAALNEESVFYVNNNPSLRLITKMRLQSIAQWMIVAANEEGVVGLKEAVMNRTVVTDRRTIAAATETIWPTVIAVALILSMLVFIQLLLSVMIVMKIYKKYPSSKKAWKWWRLQISKQDMRAQIANDLQQLGHVAKAQTSNVRLRLVRNENGDDTLRLLPGKICGENLKTSLMSDCVAKNYE